MLTLQPPSDKLLSALSGITTKPLNTMPVRCRRCGQELTDPESVERGIGPICSELEQDEDPDINGEWKENEDE